MFVRTLKTNIIISMVILLLIGMLLIDFVMVRTTQRELIQDKISKGYFVASLLRDAISMNLSNDIRDLSRRLQPNFADILSENDFSSIFLMGAGNRVVYSAGKEIGLNTGMEKLMGETLVSGKRIAKFSDTTWGVFWYQRKNLLISTPVRNGDIIVASIGILMNLEPIYANQRKSQRFVLFYLVINTLILTVIGFYRLSKVYLEPINRLVGTAEDYQEADGDFFPVRKQDNELSKLSKALNGMIHRISEDKKALQSAVDSLEKTNLELKKAQGEIIRAEKLASIGRLSSGIAHEIGNPIGIVTGYLDLMKQEDIPEHEKKEFIQRITKEIHRMDRVIRQLLDLSRSSSVETKLVSVHEIIDDISKVLDVQPLMSKIHLSWSLKAEKDMILVDPNQLRQVFINLAINAADAIAAKGDPEHGRLIIESMNDPVATTENSSEGQTIKIVFSDNGLGIPSVHLGSIFDPFFTTKEAGKGTGLGLSVCFMIVESMGGSISAESREGEGTTMTIRLPVAG
jgi:two-component system NtrC family sensor kinase